MQINKETAALLGKIAMDGLWSGHFELSKEVFRNLIVLREDQCGPIIGLAMCYSHKGDYQTGIEVLEKMAFPAFESDPHVQVWYGFMLAMNKNSSRAKITLEKLTLDINTPNDVLNMAKETLKNIG